jgi:DNA-binding transcriptional LysR family regulator
MENLRGIVNFVRTAQLKSFAAAARELSISPVAVSQNVSRLEASLGVRLFARTTRALQLTSEGGAFLEQCRAPLEALERAVQDVSTSAHKPTGLVRATVASPVAYNYLMPLLPAFYARYPEVRLDLDLSEDPARLVESRFDVGIRVGAMNDAAFVARPLGPVRLVLCASPAYLKKNGTPKNANDLTTHRTLALKIGPQGQPVPFVLQDRTDGARGVRVLSHEPALTCNDIRSLLAACVDGIGIAQLPQPVALAAMRKSKLKLLLPENTFEGWQLFIHYPSRKQMPARVRVFIDFCVEHLGGHEDLSADTRAFVARA